MDLESISLDDLLNNYATTQKALPTTSKTENVPKGKNAVMVGPQNPPTPSTTIVVTHVSSSTLVSSITSTLVPTSKRKFVNFTNVLDFNEPVIGNPTP